MTQDAVEAAREDAWVAAVQYGSKLDKRRVDEIYRERINAFEDAVRADARAKVQGDSALRAAAKRMRDRPHVVQVREDGWGIQHPLACRPALTECLVHQAVMQWEGPPAPPGEYEVGPLGNIVGPHDEPDPVMDFLAALDSTPYELSEAEVERCQKVKRAISIIEHGAEMVGPELYVYTKDEVIEVAYDALKAVLNG